MQNQLVTTGIRPLTIGSVELFQAQPFLNQLPWDWTGGTVQLLMTDPNGNNYTFPATVQNMGAVFQWTVTGPVGAWVRAWKVVDAQGRKQISLPIVFNVISSPS